MRLLLSFVLAAAVLTFGALPVPAQVGVVTTVSSERAQAVPSKRAKTVRRGGGQVACTIYGCHPIPRNCFPTMGYNWDGIPTGFDVVVCR